ncbi:hypothetical protein EXIGLDRAFT_720542 [Exidia glandulosa HHB12029]|uniref:Uncharacterized protein n=1 Tax=Exidia glandulosa HHB12029 TaxID=1314781 RepID=A0A166AB69_EXIGL|nr:hypothetical protein EXIGLDRAFT_720542 [Exidia glandulosa HHB12029]
MNLCHACVAASRRRRCSAQPTYDAGKADSDGCCGQDDHTANAGVCTLKNYLAAHPEANRLNLMHQTAECLEHLHRVHRVVHGDVKIDKVFVCPHGTVLLPKSERTVPITSEPRAPVDHTERLPMTTATDVYAFAWLVFHVFTDIDPQELAADPKLMRLIASGVKPNRPGPTTLPAMRGLKDDNIWNTLVHCWEIFPNLRPTMLDVVKAFDVDLAALQRDFQALGV